MTTLVRLAQRADLPVVEAHMRRVLDEDLRGYHARWHHDVTDLAGSYLDRPGHALFVAELDGRFAGTTVVKAGGPASPPTPGWLAQRYAQQRTGQLARVWVAHEHRRNGVGRCLVTAAAQWALGPGEYEVLCLHTDTSSPGALEFWQSFPGSVEVLDARPDPWDTVYFELDPACLPARRDERRTRRAGVDA